MIDKKLFRMVFFGAAVILLFVGIAVGLRSGNVTVYDREYVWSVVTGTEGERDQIVRGRMLPRIHNDMNKLVFAFNKTFAEAEAANLKEGESGLELPKLLLQGHDDRSTVRVLVVNGDYLSQRMGSAGAREYLVAATYTLTDCPEITAVNFDFTPGEHAAPGVYTRMSFAGYKIVFIRK